jgi:ferredoxin
MRVRVDEDRCSGHALCKRHGPDVYVLDELGYNRTSVDDVPEALWEQARRGALACPEEAITIEE